MKYSNFGNTTSRRPLLTVLIPLFAAASSVQLNPDPSQLPGATVLKNLANGVGGWALIAAMVGVVVGAVMWAFGHYSQNYQQAYNGRRGVMVSALAAVLIGGAPHIVTFFLGQGSAI
jgi:MFS family permease